MTEPIITKQRKGFALWPKDKLKATARLGGLTAHQLGVGHEFTKEEAIEAGRKGGTQVAQDRAHMSEIGKRGGFSRARNYSKKEKTS
jgi:general stress protein YciG